MPPAEEPLISRQQRGVMDDRSRGNETICRIAVQILKLACKDGYFTSQGQFNGALGKNNLAKFPSRIEEAQPPFRDEQSNFPKTNCADSDDPIRYLSLAENATGLPT